MSKSGVICLTIDDYEYTNLLVITKQIFGEENEIATALIRNNPSGRSTVKGFSVNHEYGIFFSNSEESIIGRLPHKDNQKDRYNFKDDVGFFEWENLRRNGPDSNREDRPKQFYPILVNIDRNEFLIPEMEYSISDQIWIYNKEFEKPIGFESVFPIHPSGEEKVWRYSVDNLIKEPNRFKFEVKDGNIEFYRKKYLNEDGILPRTWWDDPSYSARDNGSRDIVNIFGDLKAFEFPKAVSAVVDCIRVLNVSNKEYTLDFFGGSGTTGHAVINLNREDQGTRKYILVEMGEYFDTVTKPRIQKVVYSPDWKDGKPTNRNKPFSHAFKYLRLESYEDTLTNLAEAGAKLAPSTQQQALLDKSLALKEDYLLRYALDLESREPLLPQSLFDRPWDAKLSCTRDNAVIESPIDMPETFNYLLGLVVRNVRMSSAKNGEGISSPVYAVEGQTLSGQQVLVLWRNLIGSDALDSLSLNTWFQKMYDLPKRTDFDVIYVNGDTLLPNVKFTQSEQPARFKVNLLESEFARLMWEGTD